MNIEQAEEVAFYPKVSVSAEVERLQATRELFWTQYLKAFLCEDWGDDHTMVADQNWKAMDEGGNVMGVYTTQHGQIVIVMDAKTIETRIFLADEAAGIEAPGDE